MVLDKEPKAQNQRMQRAEAADARTVGPIIRGCIMKKSNILLRQASLDDLEQIFDLWCQMQYPHEQYHPNYYPLADRRTVEEKTKVHLSSLIEDSEVLFLIADVDGTLVGYCIATTQTKPPVFKPVIQLMLQQAVIRTSRRRQGVFRMLYNQTVSWGRSRGASQVELTVDCKNPAVEAYSAMGFEIIQHKMMVDISGQQIGAPDALRRAGDL